MLKKSPKSLASLETLGGICIFGSAFCLYMTTATIRWAKAEVQLDSTFFVFARFLAGFIIICAILLIRRKKLRPQKYALLIGRALFNSAAVFCFFRAASITTAAEANILNMTFPLFIALFFFLFSRVQKDYVGYLMTIIAFIGIWLIVSPDGFSFRLESSWGLASGFLGAIAITILNIVRRYNDTDTVLFFMFGLGMVLIYLLFPETIFIPNWIELKYLLVGGLFGVLGQYLLTIGFKYVTAVEGGVIASSRILIAAIAGPYMVADPHLTLSGWIGAVLILGANVYLTIRKIGIQPG